MTQSSAPESHVADAPAGQARFPIPSALNLALVAFTFAAAVALLTLASRCDKWWQVLLVGVVFSYVMLTDYALLHEATHDTLHPSPRGNYWLGVITGALFPVPFTMVRTTHQNHHHRNRTDSEMFDLYYPTDNLLRKYAQWYSILCGLFWPMVPIGSLVFALSPRVVREWVIRSTRATGGYLLGEVRGRVVQRIRVETLIIVLLFAAMGWLLGLRWWPTLVCYACFSFNWSTRQYVAHAFTRRHVIDGAWNLEHHTLMRWLLLNANYDLNHHRRPDVPWLYLPRLSPPGERRRSYLRQYWQQWLGPRPATEPPPDPLPPGSFEQA